MTDDLFLTEFIPWPVPAGWVQRQQQFKHPAARLIPGELHIPYAWEEGVENGEKGCILRYQVVWEGLTPEMFENGNRWGFPYRAGYLSVFPFSQAADDGLIFGMDITETELLLTAEQDNYFWSPQEGPDYEEWAKTSLLARVRIGEDMTPVWEVHDTNPYRRRYFENVLGALVDSLSLTPVELAEGEAHLVENSEYDWGGPVGSLHYATTLVADRFSEGGCTRVEKPQMLRLVACEHPIGIGAPDPVYVAQFFNTAEPEYLAWSTGEDARYWPEELSPAAFPPLTGEDLPEHIRQLIAHLPLVQDA